MTDEKLKELLTERKAQAEKERHFHICQAHIAEGILMDAVYLLGELEKGTEEKRG